MGSNDLRRIASGALLLPASLLIFAAGPRADTPAAGDLWEVTSKMSMEGMPFEMPANKSKICAARDWNKPPAGDNPQQKCTRSNYAKDGNKVTWKETCDSPPMTGEGEITREGDSDYSGTIKYTSDQGNMTIKLVGHKVGTCDKPS
jgi:hypothetical protein